MVNGRLVIVVIGRNEGERLQRALASAAAERPAALVYVDSGSTDGSVERARGVGHGVIVQALDPARPFTAARGRNEGFERAIAQVPDAAYVQFLDGDCVLCDGWIDRAIAHLDVNQDVALVAGRLREEYRERNVYHRLADMEWDVPAGDVESTGGICMIRVDAFRDAGGFDPAIAAGEELNLALRLAAAGDRIVRLADDMARHDIRMDRFGQWWTRAKRYGHATADSVYLYGLRDAARRRELASIVAWGAAVPGAAVGLAAPTLGLSVGLFGGYPALFYRIRRYRMARGDRPDDATLYAAAQIVAKFAAVAGVGEFARRWVRRELAHGRDMVR